MNSERSSQEINSLVSVDKTQTTAQISEQNPENDAQDSSAPSHSTAVSGYSKVVAEGCRRSLDLLQATAGSIDRAPSSLSIGLLFRSLGM